jgi:hypothetical protein
VFEQDQNAWDIASHAGLVEFTLQLERIGVGQAARLIEKASGPA